MQIFPFIWSYGIPTVQLFHKHQPALVAQMDMPPTGGQEVAGLARARSAIFFRGDLILKYFLPSFSHFR